MEKQKLSSDADKENEIKKIQEKLKASGNKVQASLQEYRKKIEASKNAELGTLKNKSQSPAPSTSSESLSVHSRSECSNNKGEDNNFGTGSKTISKAKLDSDCSISNSSLNSYNAYDLEKSKRAAISKKYGIFEKTDIKERIGQVKSKISKFTRNNSESQRYPPANLSVIGRNRSISERSSSTASTNCNSNSIIRQRSISGNYSIANSEISNTPSHNTDGYFKRINRRLDNDISDNGKVRKKSRGKRGSKSKSKETQANAEHIPYYAKECDSLYINAETLLILDLLYLPLEQHTEFLLNLAKIRKILLPNPESDGYVYNPELKRLNNILQLGNQCRDLNIENLKKIENLISKKQEGCSVTQSKRKLQNLRLDSESQRNGEEKTKFFEDYVNEVVGEYLSEDQKKEFLFPKLPKAQRTKNYFNEPKFEAELEKYAQKLEKANLGAIVEGDIRINGKNNEQSFVKNVAGKKDAFLMSLLARKYSLHGDIVRVFVRNDDSEKQMSSFLNDGNLQDNIESLQNTDKKEPITPGKYSISSNDQQPSTSSASQTDLVIENLISFVDNNVAEPNEEVEELNNTIDLLLEQEIEPLPEKSSRAFVIKIVKHVHNRKCVGSFLSYRKNRRVIDFITFVPRDLKMPNIRIYQPDWPEEFKKGEIQYISDVLYVAQIVEWMNGICIGKVLHPIGKCGELDSENKAILLQNGLEMDPYEERFNEMFYGPLIISDEDIKLREDLRNECIFTIDPLTARDLDDAMSCKKMTNGNYEIGVHISDVTHFLTEKSELDEIVALRSTSVYMVNEVFHMLPKPLCFKCSLLPGEDKFAFSCFWEVTPSGEILNTRISRTILNSCTQFAYEHAQKIIDNPDKIFVEDDFPQIHNGWTVKEIVERVKNLHAISEIWRENRFQNGALKINRPKLYFHLDEDTGEPSEYFQAVLQPANFLIEEFMLMANQSVADFIYKKYPKIAFLRNHHPPLPNVIRKVHIKLKQLSLNVDISSSKSIYSSLTDLLSHSDNPETLEVCLTHLISKPMQRAKYFCSENAKTPDNFWHYALSIPIYTHFTSPIRRYPDVLVHRVLAAALKYTDPPSRTPDELHVIAEICNEKKYTAKLAGEDSSNLYFMYYIKSRKSILMKAAVIEFFFRSMEIILLVSGHQIRVSYPNDKSSLKIIFNAKSKTAVLVKDEEDPVELKPFSEIDVEVYVEKFKIKARLPRTRKNQKNDNEDEIADKNTVTEIAPLIILEKDNKESDLESTDSKDNLFDKDNLPNSSITHNKGECFKNDLDNKATDVEESSETKLNRSENDASDSINKIEDVALIDID